MSRRPSPLSFSDQDLSRLRAVIINSESPKEQRLCAQVLLGVFEYQQSDVIWYMEDLARIFQTTRRAVAQILRSFRAFGCTATIDNYPRRRTRVVTSEAMLDYLSNLLRQTNPRRVEQRWTLHDLVHELKRAGFRCSTFSVSQAQRILERQQIAGKSAPPTDNVPAPLPIRSDVRQRGRLPG